MVKKNRIGHKGIVESIDHRDVIVKIVSHSACGTCHAQNMCGMAESTEKRIRVTHPVKQLTIGDQVMVYASMNNAFYSVIMAYVLPSILLLIILPVLLSLGLNEVNAAVGSLTGLTLYFFILYLCRKKIEKKITFTIETINPSDTEEKL